MASVLTIDNNTNGNFDSFMFEGENYNDTRNTRKYDTGNKSRKDREKAMWLGKKALKETDPSTEDEEDNSAEKLKLEHQRWCREKERKDLAKSQRLSSRENKKAGPKGRRNVSDDE